MGQLLIFTGLLLVLGVQPVTGACKNLLTPVRNLTLYDSDNKMLETLTKCKHLVGRHPILCHKEYGKEDGLCCKACRNKDTSCVDDTLTFWRVGDQYFSCADYVNMYPCECKGTQVQQKCCKSCQKAECKDCHDYLSTFQWITVFDSDGNPVTNLTDCDTLVSNYLYLCKKNYGKEGGHCCDSCSNQDLSCIDENIFWYVGGDKQSCAEYVAGDTCRCDRAEVAQKCCASCQGKVCDTCRDYLSQNQWIDVTDSEGNVKERLTNCTKLIKDYLYLCKKKYGMEGGHCCDSCSSIDLSCIDENIFWYVGEDEQSCAEYVSGDPCRCDRTEVAEKCCASCQGKVCDTCRDYLSQNQWIEITDSEGNVKERLTNCTKLIKDYLYLCKKKYGMVGGHCCDSCSPIDLSCIDDTSVTWYIDNKEMKCEEYVKKRSRACQQSSVMSICCESCKRQEELCDDTDAKTTVKLAVGTPKNVIKCKKCSCAEIVAYGDEFISEACKKKKIQKRCCKMCQDYMP